MKVAPVVALLLIFSSPAAADNIAGRASVIDGDTVEIHGKGISPFGIDPLSGQRCKKDTGIVSVSLSRRWQFGSSCRMWNRT